MHNVFSELLEGRRGCSFECRSMLLGAFTLQLNAQKILHPIPQRPLLGLNFAATAEALRRMKYPEWCVPGGRRHSQHNCSLKSEIDAVVDELEKEIKGLRVYMGCLELISEKRLMSLT